MRYHSKFRVSAVGLSIVGVILASGCAQSSHLPSNRRSIPEKPATVTLKTDASGNIDFGDLERQLRPFRKRPPHSAPRPCTGGGTSCTVGLDVEEIGLSWDIHPDIGIGANTIRVIGQFTNQGSYPETRYGLEPHQTNYLWVMDTTYSSGLDSKMIWGFIRLGHARETQGYLIKCHNEPPHVQESYLDFEYCPKSPTRDVLSKSSIESSRRSIFGFASREYSADNSNAFAISETWFECDPGCCTGTTAKQ